MKRLNFGPSHYLRRTMTFVSVKRMQLKLPSVIINILADPGGTLGATPLPPTPTPPNGTQFFRFHIHFC